MLPRNLQIMKFVKFQRTSFTMCFRQLSSVKEHFSASSPRHLICFKQWTAQMVMDIINSAINLKNSHGNIRLKKINILEDAKVMILQEENHPVLNLAVSKSASFLGASDVNIVDKVVWDHDYNGRYSMRTWSLPGSSQPIFTSYKMQLGSTTFTTLLYFEEKPLNLSGIKYPYLFSIEIFSSMADAIFVSTATHACIQRLANQSSVPVICMRSRTHASIQALSTVMTIVEEFGTMSGLNISYVGPAHPVLNSYLLLCPMLGANIKFKCCCDKCPVSPLLFKDSTEMSQISNTECRQCKSTNEVLYQSSVIIAGPTPNEDKIDLFRFTTDDIQKSTCCKWIFFHTCPRGDEIDDCLFYHCNSRTFRSFENMIYIAASLMANAVKGYMF